MCFCSDDSPTGTCACSAAMTYTACSMTAECVTVQPLLPRLDSGARGRSLSPDATKPGGNPASRYSV